MKELSERAYKNISVKNELAELIEEFVKNHPQFGYRSISQFMEDAARKRLEELRALGASLPRFEQVNTDDNGVKILDRQQRKVVQIYFMPSGIKCETDQNDDCVHIAFALAQSDIQGIIRRKRREGWKLPDV